jgi:hypothetical protein
VEKQLGNPQTPLKMNLREPLKTFAQCTVFFLAPFLGKPSKNGAHETLEKPLRVGRDFFWHHF